MLYISCIFSINVFHMITALLTTVFSLGMTVLILTSTLQNLKENNVYAGTVVENGTLV